MKLTRAQLNRIKTELLSIEQELDIVLNGLKEHSSTFGISGREANDPVDYVSISRNMILMKRKQELEELLAQAKVIPTSKSDTIELGSKFKARFDDGEEDTFTLVEVAGFYREIGEYISIDSPLGQNVLGLKEGDTFSFQTNDFKVSGSILSIIKTSSKQKVKK